ncbi:hypothetical protein [Exiguobacterium sp. s133]|uniref:hypothetical protein n=1 Tax=Exiguobacterium sp. s133 TaxID=2751213 RepID=UPI001BE5E038|nr:hypothetical protein [Exiguobacterium sp. s133]
MYKEINSSEDLTFWMYVNEKEQWVEVADQLKTAEFVYSNGNIRDKLIFKFKVRPLALRYESGERTKDLYEKVMNIKM